MSKRRSPNLEYEVNSTTPAQRLWSVRHIWQLLIWLPILIGLAAAVLAPFVARGCSLAK
jgi:hypothetical protein